MLKVTVPGHVPLPTWQEYLDAPRDVSGKPIKDWTFEDYWKRKNPRQKRYLQTAEPRLGVTQGATKAQIKAEMQQDYIDKVRSYVRDAVAKGFIVTDSDGKEITLANLRISKRDLV
jgi:hypothetical protein